MKKKKIVFIICGVIAVLAAILVYFTFPIIQGKLFADYNVNLDLIVYCNGKEIDLRDLEIKCTNPKDKTVEVVCKDGIYRVGEGQYGKYIFVITIPKSELEGFSEDLTLELHYINTNSWYISDSTCVISITNEDEVANCQCEINTKYNDGTSQNYIEEDVIEDGKVKFSWGM